MQRNNRTVTADDGVELFVRHFTPTAASTRTLVIVHGASEHGGRYEHVAGDFVERGWNVVAIDLRGHGKSGGPRTHVSNFQRYVTDIRIVLDELQIPSDGTALLGHSMGGLVSIRFAQLLPQRISCLITMSPLLGLNVVVPKTTVAVGKVLSLVAPRWRFRSRVDPADTTRCPDALERRFNDPLISRSVTAGWFFQMKRALRAAWCDADKLTVPLLVMQAGQDRIVDPAVVEPWLRTSGSPDVTYKCLEDSLHELLNEPDWRSTAALIADWLHERIDREIAPANCDSAA